MRIAFFDFDGTLIRHEAGRICAIPALRRGIVGPSDGLRLAGAYVLYRAGLYPRADAMRASLYGYRGRTLGELRELMQSLYDRYVRKDASPAMRARVERHREAGDLLAIVTASAFFVAEPIARELRIHHVLGTDVAFDAGVCTGRVAGDILAGSAKLAAARTLAALYGVPLARCVFYSDHVSDLPLLLAVGEPVCVAPHRPLARVARARGWSIVGHDS